MIKGGVMTKVRLEYKESDSSMHGSEIYVADGWFVAAKQNGTVKWVRSP